MYTIKKIGEYFHVIHRERGRTVMKTKDRTLAEYFVNNI